MAIKALKPRLALNKAFLKVKPTRIEIECFKTNLVALLNNTNDTESEEFHKNLISDFFKNTYYKQNHFINTKGRNDLVIHNGQDASSKVGIILEVKKPTNKAEMMRALEEGDSQQQMLAKLNTKAFHELVLYYLRERITNKNLDLKHIIATNINEWFIFDATVFENIFAQNNILVKQFTDFENGRLADTRTDFFYKQIAEPFINSICVDFEFTYFNINDYQKPLRNNNPADDNVLIALYKLLSPEHFLKLPFTNDSNSLDKKFYTELLHIIGLTEIKDGGKKLIKRNLEGERNSGTLLEDTIIQLDSLDKISRINKPNQFGNTKEERLFNVALELAITWINRILFLKLLEAQLITYHKGNYDYSFLNLKKIKTYDDLNSLFFQVLARGYNQRNNDVKKIFEKVPYLNSSLFEPTEMEQVTLFISNLNHDKTVPIITNTVLKDQQGKKQTGNLNTLAYLLTFLNAYDFSSEGAEEIQEENKSLINASVLGLIFEKINGYKDGSFFTPGFITMYMCKETIRKAVVQKFNEVKNWSCITINDLYNKIEDRNEANTIVNSIKICDPAVGSGHFLVSALNEIIAVKNDLNILQDLNGKRLKEYDIEVVNDELIVTDENGELFEYNPNNKESQRIQATIFYEKQTIIENCLFGVDINANSVKICRLRLWIELLKHAYYKNATDLETLPNIDINIKCGNSLVSRFAINADLKQALKKSKWTIDTYRIAVATYRNAENKDQKREMESLIESIKADFRTEIYLGDTKLKKLSKLNGDLFNLTNKGQLFEQTPKQKILWNKQVKLITDETSKLFNDIEDIKTNKIYENAFEWRFEFPEVLNDDGDFMGFDVIIGNPPYGINILNENDKIYFKKRYNLLQFKIDTYELFLLKSMELVRVMGTSAFIIPSTFIDNYFGENLRELLITKYQISKIIELNDKVFDEAVVHAMILTYIKKDLVSLDYNVSYSKEKSNLIEFIEVPAGFFLKTAQKSLSIREYINRDFYNKLKLKTIPLKEIVSIRQAIKTGNDSTYITNTKLSSKFKKVIGGRSIGKWFVKWDNKYVNYGSHLACARNPKIFEQPKILIREAGNKIIATLDKDNYYILSSLYNAILINKNYEIEFVISLLNSKLFQYLLNQLTFEKTKGAFTKARIFHYYELPIKILNKGGQAKFVNLVNIILNLKRQNPSADVIPHENKIDKLVYKLYNLTDEEIKIVEGI